MSEFSAPGYTFRSLGGYGMEWDGEGMTTFNVTPEGEKVDVKFTPHPLASSRMVEHYNLLRSDRHCRVYWGSHGCHLERGHRGGHRCFHDETVDGQCIETPDEDSTGYGWMTRYYGEDAPKIQLKAWIYRLAHWEWLRRWRRMRRWKREADA